VSSEKIRASIRKTKTGWSAEVFESAWESQAGLCALCGEPMTRDSLKASSGVADHWEPDGVKTPRSILHSSCNTDLGCIEKLRGAFRVDADMSPFIFKGRPLALYLDYLDRHGALK